MVGFKSVLVYLRETFLSSSSLAIFLIDSSKQLINYENSALFGSEPNKIFV